MKKKTKPSDGKKPSDSEFQDQISLLENTMDNSPFAMWISDSSGTIIKTNKVLRETLQLNNNQIIGIYNVFQDENLKKQGVLHLVEKVFTKHKTARFEIPWSGESTGYDKFKEASSLWIDVSIFPIIDSNGNIKNLVCQWVDITERKHAEEALKESEARLITAQKIAQIGDFIWNIETGEVTWSQGMYDLLGYNKSDKIDFEKVNTQIHHSDDLERIANWLNECIKSNISEPSSNQYRLIHKDGNILNVQTTITLKYRNNKPFEMVGTVQNISDRIKAEQEIKRKNEYIQRILDDFPIGIATNEIDTLKVLYINPKFSEIYGWPSEDFPTTIDFFNKVFPDKEYREKLQVEIMADIESGDPERMHWDNLKITTKSGEEKTVYAFNIPLLEQNIMVSTVQDVTERKITEEELLKHRLHLEELVKERTKELKEKNEELERYNKLFVGREFRIKDLKEEMAVLKRKIQQLENQK